MNWTYSNDRTLQFGGLRGRLLWIDTDLRSKLADTLTGAEQFFVEVIATC